MATHESVDHRARLVELRRRVVDEARLGEPVPAVSPAIARLLGDLVGELGAVVLELELVRSLAPAGGDAVVDVERPVFEDPS